ncbi:hypothetical protein [Paludisphaera borealis]|uniref:Peptidase C-terminal archaeal/bacterial domain-containing protein n=1 Tax=Paludisphaera borealis TaxID=1387353 RepID=A0A1U7CU70_9BACT|nr:hypothetical protein [Paludisphaera borealis]APW62458.1 hypothetical protein BSF38_04004 [Paludisphaera borealis]
MSRILGRAVVVLVLSWIAEPSLRAEPPTIGEVSPFGVKRGESAEVNLTGANLAGNPRLIAPFPFQLEPTPPEKSNAGAWVFKVNVPATVAVGVYPIRVQTDDGISNPFLFAVGQLPQVAEKEENSTFETAQAVPAPPLVIEGRAAANDVDYFKFTGKKGQKIVVDAQCARLGSGVDPSIRLTTASASRRFIASADDSPGLLTDARLVAELPEDTDYVVEISDSRYLGGGRPVYRLTIGVVPIAEEIYPLGGRAGETVGFELRGGTLNDLAIAADRVSPLGNAWIHWPKVASPTPGAAGATDVESLRPILVSRYPEIRESTNPADGPPKGVAPVVFNGRIDPPGDEDRFTVAVTPGQKVRIKVEASQHGSKLDGVLQVLNPKGAAIGNADDTTTPGPMKNGVVQNIVEPDPSLTLAVPGDVNEVTLVLHDLEKRGGIGFPYRILVEPVAPDFDVHLNDAQASIPKGGTAVVGVTLTRREFDGPITLSVLDPPAGLTFRPGTIAAGQVVGALSLSATADAAFPLSTLKLVGVGQGPSGPIQKLAVHRTTFASQEFLPTNVLDEDGLTSATAQPTLATLDAPAGPLEVAHGQSVSIPIKVVRAKDANAALAIASLALPPGLTAPAATIAEKAGEGTATVAAAPEAALGAMTVALTAKGKFAPGERTLAIPAVTLNVVRPIELTLAAPAVELAPGATVEVKGKVVRKGSFKDPVVIRLDGLPAGLKADPATVAPGASDFVVKVTAAADAKPAEAAAKVAAVFQIDKKDYAFPPSALAAKIVAPKPK